MRAHLPLVLIDHGKMTDIPGHHLSHALLHGVALGGHHQVCAHGGDLLDRGALARLPQESHLFTRQAEAGSQAGAISVLHFVSKGSTELDSTNLRYDPTTSSSRAGGIMQAMPTVGA